MSQIKSCLDCERSSDNRVFNCPPRMADGRHFTDYRPRCMSNFIMNNDSMNSYEYRQYLIHNADNIMKNNSIASYKDNMCGPCVDPYDQGTMLPEQYLQSCNKNTCKFVLNDQNGLGLGRQNMVSEESRAIKSEFLKNKENEQLYFKQNVNCCSTPSDDLNSLPFNGFEEGTFMRTAVPSGAPFFSFKQ